MIFKHKLFNQVFTYTAADFISKSIAFLLIPLYTYYLLPEEYAVVAILSTTALILSILFRLG